MKKIKILSLSIITCVLLSCTSTPVAPENNNTTQAKESVQTTQPKAEKSKEKQKEKAENNFLKSLEGIKIKCTQAPKEITNGKSFSSPFTFQVNDKDGNALADFPLTLSYPSEKKDGKVIYSTSNLKTDENGSLSFTAETENFPVNTKLLAYPTPDSDDPETLEKVKELGSKADWKVRSDIARKGAALFIWDFNENDRPVNNSYYVQAEFRSRSITMVGNGPVNETSYIGKPEALYKDTFDIIGEKVYGYLLYGTIKFQEPVTELEDGSGYSCVLKSEIIAFSMKNGEKIYSSELTYESKGKNWNECVSKGKDNLSKLIVDDIIYGL